MRETCFLIFAFIFSFHLFSQEMGEELRDGKMYKVYAVMEGNTLYGLHKHFDVPIEDIISANPEAKDGLKIGQKLYIPYSTPKKAEVNPTIVLHEVKRKETLYGISRQYECTIQEIIDLNPDVVNGLSVGEEIKIPQKVESPSEKNADFKEKITESHRSVQPIEKDVDKSEVLKDTSEIKVLSDSLSKVSYQVEFTDSIIEYEVQKGETLYSISRRFMVPLEKIIEDNGLKSTDVKPRQILKIKLKNERIKEVLVKDISLAVDSTYFIRRPDLVIKKDKYNVLVALPLNIHANSNVLSGYINESTTLDHLTDISISFLMGAQMALDSLEKLGLNASVEFYDTEGNLDKFKEYLKESNPTQIDLVIGPFYPTLLEYAAAWGKSNKVPIVAVTKIPSTLLKNNPYLISTVPSDLTLISGMAKYLSKYHSKENVFIIEGENEEDKKRISYFKEVYIKNLENPDSSRISTIGIGSSTGDNLSFRVSPDRTTYFVNLSSNTQQIMRFANALNAAKNRSSVTKRSEIIMVGLNEWKDIPALNSYYKNRFEFHFAASNYLDYTRPNVIKFTKEYREKYESDPSKYAFHGFDVVLSQVSDLFLGYNRNHGLMDVFDIKPVGQRHGSENTCAFISKQSNFDIVLLKVVSTSHPF